MADPRRFVDQGDPLRLELCQRLVDVLDLEADVVEPALPLRDHALVLAVGALAGDQLDHRLSDVVERELPLLVLLLPAQRNSEAPFPQPAAGFGISHYYTHVFYSLYLHTSPSFRHPPFAIRHALPTCSMRFIFMGQPSLTVTTDD